MLKYDSVLPICTKPREDRCEADSIVYGISILQMILQKYCLQALYMHFTAGSAVKCSFWVC